MSTDTSPSRSGAGDDGAIERRGAPADVDNRDVDAHGARTPSGGSLPERFDNPGLPEHVHRMADTDPRAARRAERQVSTLFLLSAVGTIATIAAVLVVRYEGTEGVERLAAVGNSTKLLGIGMFLALMGIGLGAVHWAKTLMPDEERVEMRHSLKGSTAERAEANEILREGSAESGLGRRPVIRNSLIGALGLFPLPAIFLLRDTGPLPGDSLATTVWQTGVRLVRDPQGTPILASDIVQGSIVHALPENLEEASEEMGEFILNEKAKAPVILLRLSPDDLNPSPEREGWAYQGIVAYSKICTHMGCPVALYEQNTHHLLCPCHQSTFDLEQECKVIFGPAKRALPQLQIDVDDEGYLIAAAPFSEPVGPSYWERG